MGVHDILLDRQRAGWKKILPQERNTQIIVRKNFFLKSIFFYFLISEEIMKAKYFSTFMKK